VKKYQLAANIVWMGLAILLIIGSQHLGIGTLRKPGSAIMPFLVGVLLLIASVCLLVTTTLQKEKTRNEQIVATPATGGAKGHVKMLLIVLGALIVYGFALEPLGFLVASFLLMFFLFWGMRVRFITSLWVSILAVAASYSLFTYFGVVFPDGVLVHLREYWGF
jgi:hypothetical protein